MTTALFAVYRGYAIHRSDVKKYTAYNKKGAAVCSGSSPAEVLKQLIRREK